MPDLKCDRIPQRRRSPRRSSCLVSVALIILAVGAVTAWGQDLQRYMLTEAEFNALPQEAKDHYTAGVAALDRIDFIDALNEYRQAAEAAPNIAAIQFKLVDLAQRQARVTRSRRAEDYLVLAREALERVLDSAVAGPEDQRRAERLVQDLNRQLDQAPADEQRRLELGRTFLHSFSLQQDWFEAGRNAGDMKRAVLTEGGAGSPVTRSEVVLIDSAGNLYHVDRTPFMRSGTQLNRNDLGGATLDEEPETSLFTGEVQSAAATPPVPGAGAQIGRLSPDMGTGSTDLGALAPSPIASTLPAPAPSAGATEQESPFAFPSSPPESTQGAEPLPPPEAGSESSAETPGALPPPVANPFSF
jgi:hypothetical protein